MNYPKRWTKNVIQAELESRGYWLSVEGRTYNIFSSKDHRFECAGTKADAILFILADDLIGGAERRTA